MKVFKNNNKLTCFYLFLTNETVFFTLYLKCSLCAFIVRSFYKCMIFICNNDITYCLNIIFCSKGIVGDKCSMSFSKHEKTKFIFFVLVKVGRLVRLFFSSGEKISLSN